MEIIAKDSLYYLFLEIQRLHYHRGQMLLDEIGIYHGQPPMLFALNKKDGQSQRELSEILDIKPSTITVMLNRMEKTNLVRREQDTKDQRVSRVYLTDKGKETCEKSKKIIKKIENELFDNITIEEKVILRRLMIQMKGNLTMDDNKELLD